MLSLLLFWWKKRNKKSRTYYTPRPSRVTWKVVYATVAFAINLAGCRPLPTSPMNILGSRLSNQRVALILVYGICWHRKRVVPKGRDSPSLWRQTFTFQPVLLPQPSTSMCTAWQLLHPFNFFASTYKYLFSQF